MIDYKMSLAGPLLGLACSCPALAGHGVVHFGGSVLSPPCRATGFLPEGARPEQAGLALGRCDSPMHVQLTDPAGQGPATQLAVTDLDGRAIDLAAGLDIGQHPLRVLLEDLDGRSGARPLLINLTYR